MKPLLKTTILWFVVVGLVVLTGIINFIAGPFPDLTIFYLIPILIAVVYLGVRQGYAAAIIAALVIISREYLAGFSGIDIFVDSFLHLIVFLATASIVGRLLAELKIIKNYEKQRQREFEIAKKVHRAAFSYSYDIPEDLEVKSKVEFAKQLGGDYYLLLPLDDGTVFFCISDIAGKSISASLFTFLLSQTILSSVEQTADLPAIVNRVNSEMASALPEDFFVTLFSAIISKDEIKYLNAGHEPPLLYVKTENKVKPLANEDTLALGIKDNLTLSANSTGFQQGDILLAVTDGVTESPAFIEKPYKKLEGLLMQYNKQSMDDLVEAVFYEASPESTPLNDDIIITAIKKTL